MMVEFARVPARRILVLLLVLLAPMPRSAVRTAHAAPPALRPADRERDPLRDLAEAVVGWLSGRRIVTHPRYLLGEGCRADEEAWGRVHAVDVAYLTDRLGAGPTWLLEAAWERVEASVCDLPWRESARDLLFYNRVGRLVAARNPGLWGMPRQQVLQKVEEAFRDPAVVAYERALAVVCPP